MRIEPTDNTKFGIYKYSITKYHTDKSFSNRLIGEFKGHEIQISSTFLCDNLYSKLYVIYDSAHNYIKSKLKYFSNRKVWKELKGEHGRKC